MLFESEITFLANFGNFGKLWQTLFYHNKNINKFTKKSRKINELPDEKRV